MDEVLAWRRISKEICGDQPLAVEILPAGTRFAELGDFGGPLNVIVCKVKCTALYVVVHLLLLRVTGSIQRWRPA